MLRKKTSQKSKNQPQQGNLFSLVVSLLNLVSIWEISSVMLPIAKIALFVLLLCEVYQMGGMYVLLRHNKWLIVLNQTFLCLVVSALLFLKA